MEDTVQGILLERVTASPLHRCRCSQERPEAALGNGHPWDTKQALCLAYPWITVSYHHHLMWDSSVTKKQANKHTKTPSFVPQSWCCRRRGELHSGFCPRIRSSNIHPPVAREGGSTCSPQTLPLAMPILHVTSPPGRPRLPRRNAAQLPREAQSPGAQLCSPATGAAAKPRAGVCGAGRGSAPGCLSRMGCPAGPERGGHIPSLSSSPDSSSLAGALDSDTCAMGARADGGAGSPDLPGVLGRQAAWGQPAGWEEHALTDHSPKSAFALTPTRRPVPMWSGQASWPYNYFVTMMLEGWSMKGCGGVCPPTSHLPFSCWWLWLAESTRLVADILIFMYTVPNFKRKVSGQAQQARARYRQCDGGCYALSCYTYLSKKERGERRESG